ncbi:4Fe-4S binding protein [archaeon]|nr:4Fe-4S binding protein [archaeon]
MSELKGWKEIPIAGIPFKPGTEYKTGSWRTFKPVLDDSKCVRCLLCFVYCPEGCITWNETENRVVIDYDFCKGCGICAAECPRQAIEMVLEAA